MPEELHPGERMAPSLLVHFDGTDGAKRALGIADVYAQRADLAVDLLVVGSPGLEAQDRMELRDAASRLESTVGTLLVIPSNDVADEIVDCLVQRPEAIGWMATHGRARLSGLVLGSTAESVVRRSARPMVLAGPHARTTPTWGPLVICADGSVLPTAVLPAARQWADRLRCPLRLVTVAENETPTETSVVELQALADELRAEGVDAEVEVLSGRRPAEEIERYAAQHDAALVAMLTHARAGVQRAVLGSVTMAVVHHASCPVLVTAVT